MERITVTKTSLPPYEEFIESIKPLWNSRWVTNMGEYHQKLEKELRNYLQVPSVSLMVNGHMALEMAIQAFHFPEGSEVITTPYTFISTTHAIVRNGLKPIFCDIKLSDYTIDEEKIKDLITEKTVAILPVHVYGNICNITKIEEIAYEYGLKVIYDAAHAFGESYNGIGVGNFGDASIFSFHATKIFNTIEGGAVAMKDEKLYEKLYNLKNFGIRGEELVVEVGANAKMNEFSAIMGLCNLNYVEQHIAERKKRVEHYGELLKEEKAIRCLEYQKNIKYSYGYFPILFLPQMCGEGMRDKVYEALKEKNIFSRKYFYPLTSDESCFKNKYKNLDLKNARFVSDNILVLPLYDDLSMEKIDEIAEIVKKEVKTYRGER